MFGRDLRAAEHRRHMPLPQSSGYTFERIGSAPRVAGQCSNCDGMGRETYETDSGSLSTQTCTACGGTGVTASRKGVNRTSARKQASSYKQEQIIDAYYAGEFGNRVKGIEFVDNPSLVNKQVYLHIRARGKQRIFVPWNGEWYGAGGSGNGLYDLKRYLENWGKHSSRRTAFLDTVELTGPRHRVAGWNWDDRLNGFVAAEAAREFTCACGDNVPAPGYTDCRCGKRWNTYTIQANGSKKMIAREVPVRDGVVMANRRTAFRKQAAEYSDYSYDQLVDERDILRQQYADWEIDQSEYKDTLAEIEAEAESRGLTLASRKGRVVARRTASERDQVLEDWIAFLEKKGLPRNTGTWEPEASDFDSSGYSGEAMEFLYEWSSGKMGSRKRASDAYLDELKEWYPVEYNAFMESLSPGTVYEPGELEILHKKWVQTQGPFDEGDDGMTASRKQARDTWDDWVNRMEEEEAAGTGYGSTPGWHVDLPNESPGDEDIDNPDSENPGRFSRRKQANVTWYPAPNNSFTTYDGPDPFGSVIPIGTVSENHGQYRWNVDDGADFFESGSEGSLQAAQSAVEQALSRAPSPPAGGGGGGGFGGDELEQFLNWRTDMGKMNENAVSDQELLQDLNEYNPPFDSQETIKQELGLF